MTEKFKLDFLEYITREISLSEGITATYDLENLVMRNDSIIYHKTPVSLKREFNQDIYGNLFERILESPEIEFSEFENILDRERDEYIFKNSKHYFGKSRWLREYINSQLLSSLIKIFNSGIYSYIYEFGAGYGSKIINLARNLVHFDKDFFAIDLSRNGLNICNHFSNKYNLKIKTINFNFETQCIENLKVHSNSVLISSFGLHYIKKFDDNFLENLINNGFNAGIHFEPCSDLLPTLEDPLYAKLALKYAKQNNYTLNIAEAFKKCAKKGLIKLKIDKNVAGFGLLPGWLIEWERI